MRTLTILIVAVSLAAHAGTVSAWTYDGTIKLGGIVFDEETGSDLSAVQETYDFEEGFSISQLELRGTSNARHGFLLDLRDINIDTRQADFWYRIPGKMRLTGHYDQNRYVFDPDRVLNSDRKDWRLGLGFTPTKELRVSANYNVQNRKGDRLGFPSGTVSQPGAMYDYSLRTGRLEAEYRKHGRAGALAVDFSSFANDRADIADRSGRVLSARLYTPDLWLDRHLTHTFRAAYGLHELTNGDLDYTLANFQYTAAAMPLSRVQLKYQFYANRIEDDATGLQTDNLRNDLDATVTHRFGKVFCGYGYETNDDDRSLTDYNTWWAGTTVKYKKLVRAEGSYSSRIKNDEEDVTLLKDIESAQVRAKLQIDPIDHLVLGGGFVDRRREFIDINVEAEGQSVNGHGRYEYPGWGSITGDYTFTTDDYDDLAGGFEATSDVVTGRLEITRLPDVTLASGVTYIDVGEDLDIEKSMVFFEGAYTFRDDYFLELKYNVYNYDDYVLLDRYYTANVVWINVGYRFSKD